MTTKLEPYVFFNDGKCREALEFYAKLLGGKIEMMMTYGEMPNPEQAPPGSAKLVMHARLATKDFALMASDACMGEPEPMLGFRLSLGLDSVDEAKRLFDALSDGGSVVMPLAPTFWSKAFAMLADRYGTPWMINVPADMPA